MSKRSDIIDGSAAARAPYGLVYTEVLGWIDLGHAQGTDIRNLLRSIALAMMMSLARKFEGLQSSFPISLTTDSGFSGEDLVSNLLGFYRVVSAQNLFGMLHPVSKEEALKRWDYYGKIGSWKNENFRPLLFPDPEMFPNARPRKGELPNFMKTVSPWSDFRSGIVSIASADGSYIDKAKGGILPYA
ncbi:hypothetical protein MUA02_03390 [Enterobacteriaceae bacterium H20N1]|uniref:Uncharacterized protein n=1 Tax=Dryocola boscaweniae TaxID=2925397 RepID=A0A9X3AMU6_9ENTR|nr:hypothetical protein [Dryocola boscaweniae]MCT4701046.1 hypothetical protein [Dryocola boscaweniae]MCT4714566.1 hypothetical protein [Dryocola boscaweniae]MCT4718090.1 hypothetical protein [Dryocola boscaweniae]